MKEKRITYFLNALQKYGLKFCLRYLIETHLFDIRYGVKTGERIFPSEFKENLTNLKHGEAYMPGWTSEIRRSFYYILNNVPDVSSFNFFDIGCGKGKVILIWRLLAEQHGLTNKIYGIDYYEEVIRISKENHKKLFGTTGDFINADATSIPYVKYGEKNIFYLFNPFDRPLLIRFLEALNGQTYIIYNNPKYSNELSIRGYELIYAHNGGIESLETLIFQK